MALIAEGVVNLSATGMESVKGAFSGFKSFLSSLGLTPSVLGITAATGAIAYAIKKYADFESVQRDLKDALEVSGQAVKKNMELFTQLGGAIAQLTPISRGETNELLESALAHGATGEEASRLTATAIGLGKALRINAGEALEYLARQDDRAWTAMGRLNKEIADAATPAEKLAVANRLAAQGMKQLEGQSDTIKGALAQLGQTMAGIYTKLGGLFAPLVRIIIDGFKESAKWSRQLVDTVIDFGFRGGESFSKVGGIMTTLGNLWKTVFDWLHEKIKEGVFYLMNWGETWKIIKDKVSEYIEYLAQRWQWFGANYMTIVNWIADNTKVVWGHMVDYCAIRFGQLVLQVKAVAEDIKAAMNPLTSGQHSKTAEMYRAMAESAGRGAEGIDFGAGTTKLDTTEFTGKVSQAITDALKGDRANIDKSWKEFLANWDKTGKKTNGEVETWLKNFTGKVAANEQHKTKGGHESAVGLTDIWKNTQMRLLGGDTGAKQLAVAQSQLVVQKKTLETMGKAFFHGPQVAVK